MRIVFISSLFFIVLLSNTQFLCAEGELFQTSQSTEEENTKEHRRRKSCLSDFRQCARKTIENYDDKRGSNARACERWKNLCAIHYPAIFKTIDDTTDYKVISKDEFKEFQDLKRKNNKTVTVEKDGNKVITITTEIDDEGNEKITKTIETTEEIEKAEHSVNNTYVVGPEVKEHPKTQSNIISEDTEKDESSEAEVNTVNIDIKEVSNINEEDNSENNMNDESSDIEQNSFNIKNIVIDTEEKDEIHDPDSENEEDQTQTHDDVKDK